jgi:hypothetical protein
MNVEIEFLEWVHPRAGVTKVEVENGKPLVLKAKIKHEWIGLTEDDRYLIKHDADYNQFMTASEYADRVQTLTEARLKDKNT